jgi:biofilm PGA synthesis protein PgaD
MLETAAAQSASVRSFYGFVTILFWAFWVYLWLPLLALLAWALGLQQAYKYMIVLGGYQEVLRLLWIYALIVLVLGGTLVLWATYNIIRFRGVERRTRAAPLSTEQIAAYFNKRPEQLVLWHGAKRLLVIHDVVGHVVRVDVPAATPPVAVGPRQVQD